MIASLMRFREIRSGADMCANSEKDRPTVRLKTGKLDPKIVVRQSRIQRPE
jgi:hypothetical protein